MKPSEMTDEQLIEAVLTEVLEYQEGVHYTKPIYGSTGQYTDFYLLQNGRVTYSWRLDDPYHWMMVVEKMREKGWITRIDIFSHAIEIQFYNRRGPAFCETNESIGRAICEAALEAVRGGDAK